MAQNEIELHGELGTGSLLPGGKLGLRYRRTWESRRDRFFEVVTERSGDDIARLEEQLETDERFGDVVLTAVERVVRVGDGFYRDALARCVAAALDRSTPIDVVEALVDRLLRLDVASLRLLYELYRARPEATWAGERFPRLSVVMRELRSDGSMQMVDPALAQLEAAGFVDREWEVSTAAGERDEDPVSDVSVSYERTDWGRRAYDICLAHEDGAHA